MKSARIGWGSIYPNHVQDCKKAHPDDIGSRTDHILHICAGSGSVPNFSILKHALEIHPDLRHTFLYSNKTWNDIIYRRDLEALETKHRDRLRVIHTLTREADASRYGPSVFRGRMDTAFLRNWIPDPSACVVYACGPAISPWDRASAKRPHVRQFATPPGVVMSRPVSVAADEDTGGRFTALARVLLYILSPPYGGGDRIPRGETRAKQMGKDGPNPTTL